MSPSRSDDLTATRTREAARIRAEYARRAREVPADRYSPDDPAHRFLMDGQDRAIVGALTRARRLPLIGQRVLEIGCGSGRWLRFLIDLGADPRRVHGVDLDMHRLDTAHTTGARIHAADASALPFGDRPHEGGHFDLVMQSTVMTSILDNAVRQAVADEMLRVLTPDGIVLWYDFRIDNPRNPHVRGVSRRELRHLFPDCAVDVRRTTLAPPLARFLAPRLPRLAALLDRSLLFATHDLALIRRRA